MSEARQSEGADGACRRQGRTLVTGASGHLGANLVRQLLADGQAVRVLYREGSNNSALDGLDVERVRGDLRDPEAMRAAARGCRYIYHCAARVSTVAGGEREIYECNVLGTRNLLRAAVAAGVERVVVTGSFSAVGHLPDRPSDEEVPFYPFDRHLPYAHTKALVEHECWHAAAAEGLDVVVVTSCAIVGPNDFKPSRMGRLLCDFAAGRLRAYVPGGFDFVSTHDIVQGHLLAMQRGRRGHRYIISTQFHTMDEIMQMFSEITGRKRLPLRLPGPLMSALAEVTSFVGARLFPGREQLITPAAVRLLRLSRRADTSKAQRELGFRPTSIRPALQQAYEFFVRRGQIAAPARRAAVPRGPALTTESQPGAGL
ncbi:MAG: SDR family oxidoreductase [Myxococcales bacterium]|nr:SDR family oxidoreductase [Myxococcota bacterium]MDW8283635.1 SDR family oxidoreductase [Myxococcales bacterium]